MKKKDFKREIWILLAEETISREQYANFGRIENGEAEAERWLGLNHSQVSRHKFAQKS